MKRGFTIIEMLIVISVIGVLMGIVTTAARNSVRDARDRRRQTMATVLEQGMATFYQRAGQWPRALESKIQANNFNDTVEWYELTEAEVDDCFREIVRCSTDKKDPVMDVTGLFVAPSRNAKHGLDFNAARKGTNSKARKIGVGEMVFGFAAKDNDPASHNKPPKYKAGQFIPYGIKYSIPGDSVKVYPVYPCDKCNR